MCKKYITPKYFYSALLVINILFFNSGIIAQNTGTVNFSVTTNRTYQNFDPRNIMAVWITDEFDNFVQTLKKRANTRQQYLYKWIASSNQNTVNAITGATLSLHQTHNLTWDCQDISGNTVPDGLYKIRCEFTTRNGQGPWTPDDYIMFYKGSTPVDATFNNYDYNNQLAFSNITLIYTPDVTGLENRETKKLDSDFQLYQNFPNPFNPSTNIEFNVPEKTAVTSITKILIYNSRGQIIRNLYHGNISGGKYQVKWDGKNDKSINQPSGVYYFQLISGNVQQTRKMILIR